MHPTYVENHNSFNHWRRAGDASFTKRRASRAVIMAFICVRASGRPTCLGVILREGRTKAGEGSEDGKDEGTRESK
uniref:Uncharacterized protein n=1 Tax=Timema genevievae TaxID=629358 RepID=A0A7R9JYF6_TIMGE|nr:unnamed protein product [Timema genevievae]